MNIKSLKIGILGYGEIGKAIAQFYKNPKIKDLTRNDGLENLDVLHICIPWSNNFCNIACKEIKSARPKLTIIHSTLALGETKKIISKLPKDLKQVVHSPVRGVHPFLQKGIKTFVKYIGAENKKSGLLAESHLNKLGIKTKLFVPSTLSEALKLWDTTQYGWMIVLNKAIKEWCLKNKIDFEAIYIEANKTYNEGYKKLGRNEVQRPHLKYMKGKIGGHCVIPNCKILDSKIAKIILKENNKY